MLKKRWYWFCQLVVFLVAVLHKIMFSASQEALLEAQQTTLKTNLIAKPAKLNLPNILSSPQPLQLSKDREIRNCRNYALKNVARSPPKEPSHVFSSRSQEPLATGENWAHPTVLMLSDNMTECRTSVFALKAIICTLYRYYLSLM